MGIEVGNVTDAQLTASSVSGSLDAANARLNMNDGWVAGVNDQEQWLQIDLYRQLLVTGVVLQGRGDAEEWVTTYNVEYGIDGVTWDYVRDDNETVELFEGSWDGNSLATHMFFQGVIARYIRIRPRSWNGNIALRVELLGCPGEKLPCVDPLGVEAGNITDSQLTASSKLNNDTSATSARLNHQPESPESQGAWVAEFDDQNQWIQAGLLRQISITGVIVQGNPSTDKWVTRFQVQHSLDNVDWLFVKDGDGNNKVFPGSLDRDTPVISTFQEAITAQYIRVVPIEWHGNISMRFELLGCQSKIKIRLKKKSKITQVDFTCLEPIGLEDYNITDEQISSSHHYVYTAKEGRLNGPRMWMSRYTGKWIEVNIYRQIILRGIIVQGSPDDTYPYWTRTYRVKTSLGNNIWRDVVDEDGVVETFEGSWDRFAPVTHLFYQPIYAQYVRIFPLTKQGSYYALRFEILGCRAQTVSCQDYLGMKNGDILLNHITSTPPRSWIKMEYARLDQSYYGWTPAVSENSWLQVNLLRQTIVTGVIMQGYSSSYHVEDCRVITSLDGFIWHNVTDEDAPTLPCIDPFGMESGLIIDNQITASTASSDTSSAIYARYNQLPEVNGTTGAWMAGVSDSNQWLQINLFRQMMVTGVNMQGNPSADQWVTRYKVEISLDHTIWEYVHDEYGEIEVFEGSYDRDTNTTHLFYEPVKAHYVRIRPVEWHGQISMRVELLGCPVTMPCQDQMGIEVGNITDGQLTASSVSGSLDAANARLNMNDGWVAGVNDQEQWLQINLYRQLLVTGVVLQGRGDAEEWVTTYNVEYGIDGVTWDYVRDDNETVELFQGSWDQNSLATHLFFEGVIAQYIRIRPRSWNGNIAFRVELLGCPGSRLNVKIIVLK
ncbi:uncharacterized protein [Amphiura filiformis]|uniref:uncharacterized protein n=1 Tax=Amphiura filiformis TaxID=82378 RepID=UPI003B21A0D1